MHRIEKLMFGQYFLCSDKNTRNPFIIFFWKTSLDNIKTVC